MIRILIALKNFTDQNLVYLIIPRFKYFRFLYQICQWLTFSFTQKKAQNTINMSSICMAISKHMQMQYRTKTNTKTNNPKRNEIKKRKDLKTWIITKNFAQLVDIARSRHSAGAFEHISTSNKQFLQRPRDLRLYISLNSGFSSLLFDRFMSISNLVHMLNSFSSSLNQRAFHRHHSSRWIL